MIYDHMNFLLSCVSSWINISSHITPGLNMKTQSSLCTFGDVRKLTWNTLVLHVSTLRESTIPSVPEGVDVIARLSVEKIFDLKSPHAIDCFYLYRVKPIQFKLVYFKFPVISNPKAFPLHSNALKSFTISYFELPLMISTCFSFSLKVQNSGPGSIALWTFHTLSGKYLVPTRNQRNNLE